VASDPAFAAWTPGRQGNKSPSGRTVLVAVLALVITVMISASWLVFPYAVRDLGLLADVGRDVKQANLRRMIGIGQVLTRTSFGTGEAQLDVLFATPEFFEMAGQATDTLQYDPERYIVFLVTETTHTEDLPTRLPRAVLSVDGKNYEASDVEGPLEVYHHRVVTVRFPAVLEDGSPVLSDDARHLSLELNNTWDPDHGSRVVEWNLPIDYPDELVNHTAWSPLVVLGLAAGLLSFVLTPCLLQLLVVYLATMTGLSAAAARDDGPLDSGRVRREMIRNALAFVVGLTALFTLTGAAMGEAGKRMQIYLAEWSPALSVLAGLLVVVMGIWVGVRSGAPVVCRLAPGSWSPAAGSRTSYLGSALIAIGFSLGCMTCFGGAIIATLLIYVGSLGSALVGSAVMLAFSIGVGVPFLLAAAFAARSTRLLSGLERLMPTAGLVSTLVIVAFGVVLLTGNFHALSDAIYPWLGL